MRKAVVSVIIPIYNAEKYLRRCLDSVCSQTFKDLEIICINDGSTDGSLGILRDFLKKDKRIIVIDQKRQGINAIRALGCKKASGEYITFVDSDDFLVANMYEKMLNVATQNDSDVVITNYNFFPKKTKNKDKWYRPYIGKNDWRFIARNTVPWNKLIKKSFFDEIEMDELFGVMGENAFDVMLAVAKKINTIDEPLYNYRVGHKSLSTNYSDVEWFKKTVSYNMEKYKYSKEKGFQLDTQNYFFYNYLYYNLALMVVAAKNNDNDAYNNAKKIVKENGIFSKKYQNFLKNDVNFFKYMFFKCFIYPDYDIARIMARIVLR